MRRLERHADRTVTLTPRDHELLRCFTAFRLAQIDDLARLLRAHFPSRYVLARRLVALFDGGFLARPPAQVQRLHHKRGRPSPIYALGSKGAAVLRALHIDLPRTDFDAKARELQPHSLAHPLQTTRATAAFLLALRAHPTLALHVLYPDGAFRERVPYFDGEREHLLPVHPDTTLVIHGPHERLALFLEIDCATEPKARDTLVSSSFFKKVCAYHAYAGAARIGQDLAADEFLVLVVTTSPARAASLRELITTRMPDVADLFWFADADAFTPDAAMLTAPLWTTATGETGALF